MILPPTPRLRPSNSSSELAGKVSADMAVVESAWQAAPVWPKELDAIGAIRFARRSTCAIFGLLRPSPTFEVVQSIETAAVLHVRCQRARAVAGQRTRVFPKSFRHSTTWAGGALTRNVRETRGIVRGYPWV